MTSKKQTSWPVPLGQRNIGLGEAVREYARSTGGLPTKRRLLPASWKPRRGADAGCLGWRWAWA